MEKIDYISLIDPFCRPVIKYMREELGIDTVDCCQGMIKGEKKTLPHSLSGYISAINSPAAFQTFLRIYEHEKSRSQKPENKKRGAMFKVFGGKKERRDVVAVYFPARIWESEKELEEEWNGILELLKEIKNESDKH